MEQRVNGRARCLVLLHIYQYLGKRRSGPGKRKKKKGYNSVLFFHLRFFLLSSLFSKLFSLIKVSMTLSSLSPASVLLPAVGFILFSLLLLNLTHCLELSSLKYLAVLFFFYCHATICYLEVLTRMLNIMIIKAQRGNSHHCYSASDPDQVTIPEEVVKVWGVLFLLSLLLLFGYKSSTENGPFIWV